MGLNRYRILWNNYIIQILRSLDKREIVILS